MTLDGVAMGAAFPRICEWAPALRYESERNGQGALAMRFFSGHVQSIERCGKGSFTMRRRESKVFAAYVWKDSENAFPLNISWTNLYTKSRPSVGLDNLVPEED